MRPRGWSERTGNSIEPVLIDGTYRVNLLVAQALGLDLDDEAAIASLSIVITDLEARGLTTTNGMGEPIAAPSPTPLSDNQVSRAGVGVVRLVKLGPWGYL